MEQQKVRAKKSSLRCPYCHDALDVESEAWVACESCLGRHHRTCWGEVGHCATCQHERSVGLPNQDQEFVVDDEEDGVEDKELFRLLDANERSLDGGFLDHIWSPLSIFLYSVLASEARFRRHIGDNKRLIGPSLENLDAKFTRERKARLESSHNQAFEEALSSSRRRSVFSATLFSITVLSAVIGFIIGAANNFRHGTEEVALIMTVIPMIFWFMNVYVQLGLHWRAVRRHEASQLSLGILRRKIAEPEAVRLIQQHQQNWIASGKRLVGATIGLTFLYPALPFWLPYAFRMPMSDHEKHEAETPELFPE